MTVTDQVNEDALQNLHRARVLSADQLQRLMECSLRTVQRRARQWGCHRSFNHNGRYYALPQVVEFDEYGIWQHRRVCFSRFGNLSQTVAGVIDEADQGLDARELAQRLQVQVHGFLSQFATQSRVTREKLGGLFRYFSAEPNRAAQQREAYLAAFSSTPPVRVSDAAAVKLLLAWIKEPEAEAATLSHTLAQQQTYVSPEAVTRFLQQHHLGPEKKGA